VWVGEGGDYADGHSNNSKRSSRQNWGIRRWGLVRQWRIWRAKIKFCTRLKSSMCIILRFVVDGNNQGSEIVVEMREGAEGRAGAKVIR
jgi:hypothetical protein